MIPSLASMKKEVAKMVEARNMQQKQHIWHYEDGSADVYTEEKILPYIPSNTGLAFGRILESRDVFVGGIMGPYGSGKSTMCMHLVVKHACSMPVWSNGRRRARWAFIRNTSGELYSTTLKTWLAWFGELGDIRSHQKPILTYEHTFSDGKGLVELEILFMALDRPQDIRKLKSIELTGVYLNEMCELPQDVLSHCKGRINGRYPSLAFCKDPYWSGVIFDTNPPDEDHWIKRYFVDEPVERYKLFTQPPGLLINEDGKYIPNPDADNFVNFKEKDYYVTMATGQREGFIKVFCQGYFGLVEDGKRVYDEYNDDFHSANEVAYLADLPIHLGWDFGLTPACVVFQVTARGQLRIIREYVSDRIGIRNFAKLVVIPSLKMNYPGFKLGFSDGDPAGLSADTIVEELSCIGELNNLGIITEAASTNDPAIRHSAVRFFLSSVIDGTPALLVDRVNAPVLRKGFVSGYVFRRLRINSSEERYSDHPDKNSFSHPHDALQYGALRFASIQLDSAKPQLSRDMRNLTFGGMMHRRF